MTFKVLTQVKTLDLLKFFSERCTQKVKEDLAFLSVDVDPPQEITVVVNSLKYYAIDKLTTIGNAIYHHDTTSREYYLVPSSLSFQETISVSGPDSVSSRWWSYCTTFI